MVERKLRLAPQVTKTSKTSLPKLFVLDTNVLMHDPTSLFRFEEHDVYLPMLTLEELDNNKKGMTEVARNARQASRFLDELVRRHAPATSRTGIPLKPASGGAATGRLFLQTEAINDELPPSLAGGKADNQILARGDAPAAAASRSAGRSWCRRTSTCASRRARSASPAEDYFNDKVLEDTDLLYTRHARAAGGFLGPPRQGHGILAAGRPHLLPRHRAAVPVAAGQRVRLPGNEPGEPPLHRASSRRSHGKTARAADAARLLAPQEQRLGHHGAQPRAEFRAQPADEPGDRFRHAARPGRHRQDAAHARRRA